MAVRSRRGVGKWVRGQKKSGQRVQNKMAGRSYEFDLYRTAGWQWLTIFHWLFLSIWKGKCCKHSYHKWTTMWTDPYTGHRSLHRPPTPYHAPKTHACIMTCTNYNTTKSWGYSSVVVYFPGRQESLALIPSMVVRRKRTLFHFSWE